MPSRSSRRRSDTIIDHELVEQLLRDGATIDNPNEACETTAAALQSLGVIDYRLREFVRCASAEDRDFPPQNRHCSGRVFLDDALDESDDAYRCPECGRLVYPNRFGKKRLRLLTVSANAAGVLAFVRSRLAELNADLKDPAPGVMRLELADQPMFVCIADQCQSLPYLSRDWATQNHVCYVTANPLADPVRFLKETWLHRVALADEIRRPGTIVEVVRQASLAGLPRAQSIVVPVYSKGRNAGTDTPVASAPQDRVFFLELEDSTARINGVQIVAPQGHERWKILKVLLESFMEDFMSGKAPSDFRFSSIEKIAGVLQELGGRRRTDLGSLRRTLNLFQGDIEAAIKSKLGLPIDRQDIIETSDSRGQTAAHGHRLNPRHVAVRPFQVD